MKVKPMVELFSQVKWRDDEGILLIGDIGIPCKRLPSGDVEMDDELIQTMFGLTPSLTEVLGPPPLPPAFGLFVGVRLTPPKTTEFFGYLYGTTGPGKKCDLFTASQMTGYAQQAIAGALVSVSHAVAEERERTLAEVLVGLRSENDSTQLRAIIASVEALRPNA